VVSKISVTVGKLEKIGKRLIRKIVRQPRKTKGGGRHALQEKRIVRNCRTSRDNLTLPPAVRHPQTK